MTETQSKQIELDKTAEEFRRLHRERQELVRQWQESIETTLASLTLHIVQNGTYQMARGNKIGGTLVKNHTFRHSSIHV